MNVKDEELLLDVAACAEITARQEEDTVVGAALGGAVGVATTNTLLGTVAGAAIGGAVGSEAGKPTSSGQRFAKPNPS